MSPADPHPFAGARGAGRSVLAVVLGYVTLILLSTLVQELWLGGVSYLDSSRTTLVLAGIFTPLAGVVAGGVTAAIASQRPLLHVLPMMLAIAVETTVLYRTGRVDGPLWFESMAALALMGGVLLGAWLWQATRMHLQR